jgi:hypothetical protein
MSECFGTLRECFGKRSTGTPAAVERPFNVVRREYGERGKENYRTVFEHESNSGREVRQVSFYKDTEGEIVRYHHQPHTWIVLYEVCEAFPEQGRYHFLNWQTGQVSSDPLLRWQSWYMLPILKNLGEGWALQGSQVDEDLRNLQKAIANSHYFRERPRARLGTAMVRGTEGGEAFATNAMAEQQRRQEPRGMHVCRTKMQNVYVFPDAARLVRRRAVLVACTYPNNMPFGPLPSTVEDALTFYGILKGRGWDARDVVILTDAPESDSIRKIQEDGSRIEGSTIDQVAKWMCRLVSGLQEGTTASEKCAKVCNSLVLYLAGHGEQYPERPPGHEPTREDDCMDEGFATSSVRQVDGGDGTWFDTGVVLDDTVNETVVRTVYGLPRTQLVIVADTCQ